MKKIAWMPMVGAAALGAVNPYITAGKSPVLKTVNNLDLYLAAGVIAADVLVGDRMYGSFGDALEGAATYEAGYIVERLVGKHLGTSLPTSAMPDFALAAAAPAYAMPVAAGNTFGDFSGFQME